MDPQDGGKAVSVFDWAEAHSGLVQLLATSVLIPLVAWVQRGHARLKATLAQVEGNTKAVEAFQEDLAMQSDRIDEMEREANKSITEQITRVHTRLDQMNATNDQRFGELHKEMKTVSSCTERISGYLQALDKRFGVQS